MLKLPHVGTRAPLRAAALIALLLGPAAQAQTDRTDPVTDEPLPGSGTSRAMAEIAADSPARVGADLALLGRLADGETRGIALAGNTLYRSNGGVLETLDVTDPANPAVLGRFTVDRGIVQGAFVLGGLAYVPVSRGTPLSALGSLQILDVTNPAAPAPVGQVTGRSFFGVVVRGTTAYTAAGTGGLRLYDVANPAAPVARGFATVSGGSVLSVALDGPTAVVTAGVAGLAVIDIANPAAPALRGTLALGGFATRVALVGTRAYVSVNDVGLVVVDVANPAAPVELGRFAIASSQIRSVAVAGTTAFVGRDDGLVALDVSNPAAITLLGSLTVGGTGSGQSIVLDGATAYVGDRFRGVRVLDVSDPAAITERRLIDNGGFAFKVNLVGTTAYVSDPYGHMRIVDLSAPAAPVETGRVRGLPNAGGVDVIGTTAYVVSRSEPPFAGVTRVDVSDPANPVVLGFTATARPAYGVDVDGTTVFVATGVGGTLDGALVSADGAGGGFAVLDEAATGNQAFGVTVRDGRAYVATFGSGLSILDVSNPAAIAPLSLGAVGGFSSAVEVEGSLAYLADSQSGTPLAISVINVLNPAAPVLVGEANAIQGGTAVDVALGNVYAYAAVDFVGLYQYDIATPAAPVRRETLQSSDRATGVDAEGRLVVLADAGAGLWIFESPARTACDECGTGRPALAVDAFPNPSADAASVRLTLPEAAAVTVEVFSTLGRRVARLSAGPLDAGPHTLRLDAGRWAAGVYVVRLTAGGQVATARLTVAR